MRRVGKCGGCKRLLVALFPLLVAMQPLSATGDSHGPVIDVWYGPHQVFGRRGLPQRWVNILGNVSDPDGIASLTYSLNSGPALPLSLGPDTRRLVARGDFNVELASTALGSGLNQVTITAIDLLNNTTVQSVTLEYIPGKVWPLPYSINWSLVENLQDVVQVVDGLWSVGQHGLRPRVLGYDRIVAIGDMSWSAYEITVPITVHGIDPAGFQWPSIAPWIGIILRWQGHSDWGGAQPTIGWKPVGAFLWYSWKGNYFSLKGDSGFAVDDPLRRKLEFGVRYYYKMRVQTVPNDSHQLGWYKAKIWPDTEPEPSTWTLRGSEKWQDLPNGSLLLVAHHVDATFGNVSIVPLEPLAPRSFMALWAERSYDFAIRVARAARRYVAFW